MRRRCWTITVRIRRIQGDRGQGTRHLFRVGLCEFLLWGCEAGAGGCVRELLVGECASAYAFGTLLSMLRSDFCADNNRMYSVRMRCGLIAALCIAGWLLGRQLL